MAPFTPRTPGSMRQNRPSSSTSITSRLNRTAFPVLLLFFTLSLLNHAAASTPSCCVLPENDIEKLKGKNKDCPKKVGGTLSVTATSQLSKKCAPCAPGLCRLGSECYCPENFIEQPGLHNQCAPVFGVKWPASIGRRDTLYTGCDPRAPSAAPTRLSCCALTKASLERLYGLSETCPPARDAAPLLATRCNPCPPGMCRARMASGHEACVCPSLFVGIGAAVKGDDAAAVASDRMRDRCLAAFGAVWPDSVKKADSAWGSCSGGLGRLEISYGNGTRYTQEADGTTRVIEATKAPTTTKPAASKPSTAPSPKPGNASGGGSASKGGNSGGGGLSGGAIFGILLAVLVGVVAIAAIVFKVCARRRSKGVNEFGIEAERDVAQGARSQPVQVQSSDEWI